MDEDTLIDLFDKLTGLENALMISMVMNIVQLFAICVALWKVY